MIENKWRQDVRHVVVEVLIIVIAAIVIYYLLDRTTSSAPTTTQTVCRSWGSCNPGQGTRYRVNAQSYLLCPTPYDYSIAVCSRNGIVIWRWAEKVRLRVNAISSSLTRIT